MEYLVDEILTRQPQPIREFLFQTSILNRLCGPLCDAVTGKNEPECNGQAYLEWLQQANFMIVPLDEKSHWYRYHPLLKRMLRYKLVAETGPQQVAVLHTRAAAWLASNGLVEEALHHLLEAGDAQAAAQLVENNRHRLLNQDNWRTLNRWLTLLPADLCRRRPGLLMTQALLCLFTFNLGPIPGLIEAIETHLQEPAVPPGPDETALIGVEIDSIRGMLAVWQGQGQHGFDLLQRALALMSLEYGYLWGTASVYFCLAAQMIGQPDIALEAVAGVSQGETALDCALTVRLLAAEFHIALVAAELPRFVQLTEYALKRAKQCNYVNITAWCHYWLGYGYYALNQLDTGVSHLEQVAKLCYNQHVRGAADGLAVLALTYQALQQPDKARETVQLLLDFALHRQNPALLAIAHSCQARLALQQGDLEAASDWLQATDATRDTGALVFWFELPRLTTCRVLIAQGTTTALQQAVEKLQTHRQAAAEQHNTLQLIEILKLQSLAYHALGQDGAALDTLKQAVTLARPGGFIRNFVDGGPPMATLLAQLARQGVVPDYIHQILAAFPDLPDQLEAGQPAGQRPPENKESVDTPAASPWEANLENLTEPLTPRELEILELLATGRSNQEIGRTLHISTHTVKTHTMHIYGKLDVNRRYQAVAKAKALRLLAADNDKNGR
jgi:LuxR family maltose regulon positive regulatory protein